MWSEVSFNHRTRTSGMVKNVESAIQPWQGREPLRVIALLFRPLPGLLKSREPAAYTAGHILAALLRELSVLLNSRLAMELRQNSVSGASSASCGGMGRYSKVAG